MSRPRIITKIVESKWQGEGRGAKVRRSIGRQELRNLDPFLMLDEFAGNGAEGAGFPDHPHRGFETVSYLLEGHFIHEDFTGRKGFLYPGDLQWMTAGRGIMHSEMPGNEPTRGLQLWVNLKSTDKMVEPEYQELVSNDIPIAEKNGVKVKVIAGESFGVKSEVRTRTPTYYLDFELAENSEETVQEVPEGWTTFVYVLEGKVDFSGKTVKAHHTAVFGGGDCIKFSNADTGTSRFVMISGEPIGEPIVQHGPFVMNTEEEIEQAITDYQRGQNGFEKVKTWRSDHGNK